MQLGRGEVEAAIVLLEAEADRSNRALQGERAARRRSNRGKLPAHLPRFEIVLAPEVTACPSCRVASVEIGEDRSGRIDVTSVQSRVSVRRWPKFACRACPNVVVQQACPARMVEGGIPTESKATTWGGHGGSGARAVVVRLKQLALGSDKIFADETVVPVHDPER